MGTCITSRCSLWLKVAAADTPWVGSMVKKVALSLLALLFLLCIIWYVVPSISHSPRFYYYYYHLWLLLVLSITTISITREAGAGNRWAGTRERCRTSSARCGSSETPAQTILLAGNRSSLEIRTDLSSLSASFAINVDAHVLTHNHDFWQDLFLLHPCNLNYLWMRGDCAYFYVLKLRHLSRGASGASDSETSGHALDTVFCRSNSESADCLSTLPRSWVAETRVAQQEPSFSKAWMLIDSRTTVHPSRMPRDRTLWHTRKRKLSLVWLCIFKSDSTQGTMRCDT